MLGWGTFPFHHLPNMHSGIEKVLCQLYERSSTNSALLKVYVIEQTYSYIHILTINTVRECLKSILYGKNYSNKGAKSF